MKVYIESLGSAEVLFTLESGPVTMVFRGARGTKEYKIVRYQSGVDYYYGRNPEAISRTGSVSDDVANEIARLEAI